MSYRIEQINSLIQSELAPIIGREFDFGDVLITVSYVDCAADLKNATIGISVLPEKNGRRVLGKLQAKNGLIAGLLKKKVKLKFLPSLYWKLDMTESKAAEIDAILNRIANEEIDESIHS